MVGSGGVGHDQPSRLTALRRSVLTAASDFLLEAASLGGVPAVLEG